MKQEIYEDKYHQKQTKKTLEELNTEEQIKRGQFYLERYLALKSEMEEREEEWNELERLYKCERDEIENAPNAFIPLIAPIINGQIASMVENHISASVKGKGYSDQKFAHVGQILTDFILRENKIRQKIKTPVKRYLLFGTGVFAIDFDPDALDGFGLPIIRTPQITKVFVDGNIRDIADYQYAEYIIEEIGFKSIMWAREEFGDDIADYLMMNSSEHDFDATVSDDEKFSFKYLKVWHRNNKNRNLQLLEMDDTGFVLRESDPDKPYYDYVNNKYPYFFFGLYQEEGEFYRFGDGKLLKFMQETLNKLYDEVITACKFSSQGRTFVDPRAECDIDQFDADPSHPIIAKNPSEYIKTERGGGINEVVERLINNLISSAQRVSRFSDLMIGASPGQKITATQAGIQTQQGNTGINDKQGDISEALEDLVKYAIGMCMEEWSAGQALRISEDRDEFEWIDARSLANIPVMVPVDDEFEERWKNNPDNNDKEMPRFMQLETIRKDEEGNIIKDKSGNPVTEPQTKSVAFDITVSIGEGLPTNKIALYNIILSLAQLQLPDEHTGQLRPLMGFKQVKKLVEELLGIPFDDALEEAQAFMNTMPQQARVQPINLNPNIPGANINGNMTGGGVV